MPEKYLEVAVMRKIDFRPSGVLKNVLFSPCISEGNK